LGRLVEGLIYGSAHPSAPDDWRKGVSGEGSTSWRIDAYPVVSPRPPFSVRHLALHQRSIVSGRRRSRRMLMPTLVASRVCSHDVADHVFPAILASHKVLGRAWERASRAWSKRQLIGRDLPHRQAAVIASPGLGLEGVGAKGSESFVGHGGLRNRKIPAPPLGGPRVPGAYWLCGHNTDAFATGSSFIAQGRQLRNRD